MTNAVSSAVTQLTAEPRLVRATDGEGWTGLLRAAERGNDEMVAVLLTHGAGMEEATPRGNTPLCVAVNLHHAKNN